MKAYLTPPKEICDQLRGSRQWHQSEGKEGSRFYWAFEELRDIDLSSAKMFEATLQDTRLIGVRLDHADLGRALANGLCIEDSQCVGTCFDKAQLVEATFMQVTASRASFRKANLTSARFMDADLGHANFEGAVCNGASFCDADLRGAKTAGALFLGADFNRVRISGIDLSGAVFDSATRLTPLDNLEQIRAEYIYFDQKPIKGPEIRTVLAGLSRTP